MPRETWLIVLTVLALAAASLACGATNAEPEPIDTPTLPTATTVPTDTPTQTDRPVPTPTDPPTPPTLDTPVPTETPEPAEGSLGDTWTRPADNMDMVYVPAGEFQRGSTHAEADQALALCSQPYDFCQRRWFEREHPAHTVALVGFWIDRTEVTNTQYALCVADGDCAESIFAHDPIWNGAGYPVVGIDWPSAVAYCRWAGARLPTEAEWEYAARGPERRPFPWGDSFDGTRLNSCDVNCEFDHRVSEYDDGHTYTAPVGSYPEGASWCGALDMAGNVWEWVADWYGSYTSGREVNPTGPSSGEHRVLRGGSWFDGPYDTRSANRVGYVPLVAWNGGGFRCARDSQ